MAGRYYQLLLGHAAIRSFLHMRMTGPVHRKLSECRWCDSCRRGLRHHIFTECLAWTPQNRRLWKRVAKNSGWKHLWAPAMRKLWKERATKTAPGYLEDTSHGLWFSTGVVRGPREEEVGEGEASGRRRAAPRLFRLRASRR